MDGQESGSSERGVGRVGADGSSSTLGDESGDVARRMIWQSVIVEAASQMETELLAAGWEPYSITAVGTAVQAPTGGLVGSTTKLGIAAKLWVGLRRQVEE